MLSKLGETIIMKHSPKGMVKYHYHDKNRVFTLQFPSMDASDYQLGEVTSQKGRPITLYIRNITGPKTKYTVIEM